MVIMPAVEPEKCNGCGLCVSVCACHALVMVDGVVAVIETEKCGWCLQCEIICPTGAISCPYEITFAEH